MNIEEREKEAAEEKCEACTGWLVRLKVRHCLEPQSAEVCMPMSPSAAARYPGDLAKVTDEGPALHNPLAMQMKSLCVIRRGHLGLSLLERSLCGVQHSRGQAGLLGANAAGD